MTHVTRYYVIDAESGLVWLCAKSTHAARGIADELNRQYGGCFFGIKTV